MTEGSPKLGDDNTNREDAEAQSQSESQTDSGPELVKIEPRPEDTTPDERESEDSGSDETGDEEGDEIGDGDDEDHDEETDDEDDEPKLKYARLTQHLSPVYRNGDMTSAFLVAGDKMIIGTHNGNIHVVQLPTFRSIRFYHAHAASVTSISISPNPPPLPPTSMKNEVALRALSGAASQRPDSAHSDSSTPTGSQRKAREPESLPNIPSNNIYIATASMDGNVCVQSLMDMRDVSLRNFARPVQAVAVSPDYKNDKTYLSGGTSGQLILTVNPPPRRSTATTVGTAAAAASGWLGSMGLGANTGRDTVLHSGEGTINTIKWSLSGKYVAWLNEHGIKIMRSRAHLESADSEDAWKRIGHIDRPQTDEWEEMAGVWKGRAEWIDEQTIELDEAGDESGPASRLAVAQARDTQVKERKIERLLVGWGGTIWVIHVHPGGVGVGKHAGERSLGRAEIAKKLRMDCIISGLSLYTQNLLLVLAYCKPDTDGDGDGDDIKKHVKTNTSDLASGSTPSEPSGGIRRRHNALAPELRLIDLTSQSEVDKDSLTVSRFERLSSNDYHLGVLPAKNAESVAASRGVLEAMAGLGNDMWNAAINPKSLFSSGASIKSRESGDASSSPKFGSTTGSVRGPPPRTSTRTVHPNLDKPGAKIFIHSPYDCVLATKRDLGDHLAWLLEHQRFEDAWGLLDDHPEIMAASPEGTNEFRPPTPNKSQQSSDHFFDDASSEMESQLRSQYSSVEKEKRRIGESWIQELVETGDWRHAAEVAAKVINTPDRWEKWIFTFAGAKKFDEIVDHVPSKPMHPPINGTAYEILLGHYLQTDKTRFRELLDRFGIELFDLSIIITELENQLKYRDVREDSVEDGEKGRDWRIVMEALARLHEANGKFREALKCYIKLQDADSAMRLIKENHLADAVTDDVPSFIALRVPQSQLDRMTIPELSEATSEAITLLVEEGQRGLIKPEVVVHQLEKNELKLYLYFYLRGLWKAYREHQVDETVCLVDDFADLAVHSFATFDQDLLMDLLKVSTSYAYEKAVRECEQHNYVPELVYLYSVTGETKRALYLIIDRLSDVSQAIAFAKDQDDPDLWEDLLTYSMDKPRFIRGLLEEVGTAIDPITLVRRIPEGLDIPGLREGLTRIMKEHEIQYSISYGVAKVLRSEVGAAQNMLRMGQRKGIKFDVAVKAQDHIDLEVKEVPTLASSIDLQGPKASGTDSPTVPDIVEPATEHAVLGGAQRQQPGHDHRAPRPGHCAKCHEPFTQQDLGTLVGFACGHVYHISHLLQYLYPGQEPDPAIVNYGNADEGRTRGGRLVGSKVTHARLLRDKISAGCPVCKYNKEVVEGSG